jgi:xylan 1,4-beta-xylosidase
MAWHYHDDQVSGPAADVELALTGLPPQAARPRLQHFRIDEDHSNAFTAWQKMGSPQKPSPKEYRALEQAGQLTALHEPRTIEVKDRRASLRFALPRQAVSLVVLEW